MKNFRIALGSASCRNSQTKDVTTTKICSAVLDKINNLKHLNVNQLNLLNENERETLIINGKEISLTTYREKIDTSDLLIVVQAFYPTWRLPNYFSFSSVGRIFTEGFVVRADGKIEDAEDNYLWNFR